MVPHKHEFKPIHHPDLTPEGAALGIRGAEIRKCVSCEKEETYVLTKRGWVPLFKDDESTGRDILLA